MRGRLLSLPLLLLAASCASSQPAKSPPPAQSSGGEAIDQAFTQPFRDLDIMRVDPSPLLAAAKAAPYSPPDPAECAALARAIAELDVALGPDIDKTDPAKSSDNLAGALVSGAIRDVLGLPFRGVVRRLTGAETRDRELRASVLAGMVRRGYLKGQAAARGCPATALADQ